MSTPKQPGRCAETFPELAARPVRRDPQRLRRRRLRRRPTVARRTTASFRIVHTGYLHTDLGLRNSAAQDGCGDCSAAARRRRDPHPLARLPPRGLQQLFEQEPALRRAASSSYLAGVLSDTDRALIADLPFVRTSRLPHPRRLARPHRAPPTCSSCPCKSSRPAAAPPPSPAKPTNTSPQDDPSSPPSQPATPATSFERGTHRVRTGRRGGHRRRDSRRPDRPGLKRTAERTRLGRRAPLRAPRDDPPACRPPPRRREAVLETRRLY